jgi:hypothetical protein
MERSCSTGIGGQHPSRFARRLRPLERSSWSASHVSSPGTWRADLGTQEGIPFVLGHALYLKAMHGGKAKHDTLDAHKLAGLLRGGRLPQAYVSPAARRATRDWLRRRLHLVRHRAERLTHGPHTNRQDHLPEIGQKIADQANRAGVAERCPDPAGQQRIAVALALIEH